MMSEESKMRNERGLAMQGVDFTSLGKDISGSSIVWPQDSNISVELEKIFRKLEVIEEEVQETFALLEYNDPKPMCNESANIKPIDISEEPQIFHRLEMIKSTIESIAIMTMKIRKRV